VGPDGGLVVTEAFVLSMVDHFRMKQLLHARYAWEILRQVMGARARGLFWYCCTECTVCERCESG
jgi:hypothetical protein